MDSRITESELVEELRRALENAGPDDAMTTKELAETLGISAEAIRAQLPAMIRSGQYEVVRVVRKRWDGIVTRVSAIRPA